MEFQKILLDTYKSMNLQWITFNFENLWKSAFTYRSIIVSVFIVFLIPGIIYGQTGSIIGKVSDSISGEPLAGVTVFIQESGNKVISDRDGKYFLRRVAEGNQLISVHLTGYATNEVEIFVVNGVTSEYDIPMISNTFPGDEIFVSLRYKAQNRALNSQRLSGGIFSTISSEQLVHFTDYTVEDAIIRIPGVQANQRYVKNIRGVGPNLYNVTIDGQRMGNTGLGNRTVDLGIIPIGVIQDIVVNKVLTPDMPADAVGGTVDITTMRPVGSQRSIEAIIGGGANTNYMSQSGSGSRALINYTESPSDVLTYAMSLYYQLDQRPWESLSLNYDVADFGEGPVDVIERITPGFHLEERNRLGGRMQITYQPSQWNTYYLQGMMNRDDRELIRHRNSWSAGNDWIDPFTTGLLGNRGGYNYDVRLQQIDLQLLTVQAGGKHLLSLFDIDYNIGWSQGSIIQEQYNFPYHLGNLNYTINMENRTRPTMEITNLPLMPDGTIDPRRIALEHIDRIFDEHVENVYTGNINVTVPFKIGSLKVGSSAILSNKDGDYNEYQYRHIRRFTLDRFSQVRNGNYNVLNHYDISYFVDPFNARAFYTGNRPSLTLDERRHYERSDIWNYGAQENIYSGYGMVTFEFGMFRLIGGARIEHTDATYDGYSVFFDDIGTYISSTDTSYNTSYSNVFPNIQLTFEPFKRTSITAAYSQTIARPDYNQLAPFQLMNSQNSTLFRGNSLLDPMYSSNIDVHLDHHFTQTGSVSVGLFYKELTGFVNIRELILDSGDFTGWSERKFVNNDDKATLYGIELSWQHHLAFLPGFLSNFSTYANYTWAYSELDTDTRNSQIELPYHSPHVVNAAINYSQGRFSTQLSYHWTAVSVYNLDHNTRVAPSIHPTNEVYMDSYQDGWSDLSFSLRFRLSDNFRFWTNVSNLLNTSITRYENTRDSYPVSFIQRNGYELNLGIQYNF